MESVLPKRVYASEFVSNVFDGFAILRDAELGAWCEFKLECNTDASVCVCS